MSGPSVCVTKYICGTQKSYKYSCAAEDCTLVAKPNEGDKVMVEINEGVWFTDCKIIHVGQDDTYDLEREEEVQDEEGNVTGMATKQMAGIPSTQLRYLGM